MVHDAAFDDDARAANALEGGDAALAEAPLDLDLTADRMTADEHEVPETSEELGEVGQAEAGEPEGDRVDSADVDSDPSSDPEVAEVAEVAAQSDDGEAAGEAAGEDDDDDDGGPAAELDEQQLDALAQTLGVLLFASPEPLNLARLQELAEAPDKAAVRQGLAELELRFERAALPLVVRKLAGGFRVMTDPRLAEVVQRLDKSRKTERISQAALETLSIIAYRQPVTKAEIEAIRGVQAGPMLRTLVDRGLVKIAGRAEQPGQPLLYGTTKEFLDRFGLGALNELPRDAELAGE
jgi:segregation and condensation protein B